MTKLSGMLITLVSGLLALSACAAPCRPHRQTDPR
ncbi:MAG: hypothetical protein ACI82N_000538 [Maricaulis sp.]|jgi:hypothetical protein